MMRNEIKQHISKKCYEGCHFKKENMELYELDLPNGVVNDIIEYNCDEEECNYCSLWRCNKNIIYNLCELNRRHKRSVE